MSEANVALVRAIYDAFAAGNDLLDRNGGAEQHVFELALDLRKISGQDRLGVTMKVDLESSVGERFEHGVETNGHCGKIYRLAPIRRSTTPATAPK